MLVTPITAKFVSYEAHYCKGFSLLLLSHYWAQIFSEYVRMRSPVKSTRSNCKNFRELSPDDVNCRYPLKGINSDEVNISMAKRFSFVFLGSNNALFNSYDRNNSGQRSM